MDKFNYCYIIESVCNNWIGKSYYGLFTDCKTIVIIFVFCDITELSFGYISRHNIFTQRTFQFHRWMHEYWQAQEEWKKSTTVTDKTSFKIDIYRSKI